MNAAVLVSLSTETNRDLDGLNQEDKTDQG